MYQTRGFDANGMHHDFGTPSCGRRLPGTVNLHTRTFLVAGGRQSFPSWFWTCRVRIG